MHLFFALFMAADSSPPANTTPPLPRCLVMIAEQNLGHASYWWAKGSGADLSIVENALVENLRKRGVTFVDHAQLTALMQQAPGKDEPSDSDVKQFAGHAGAEVVFIGKAVVSDAGQVLGTQMHSLQANVSVRLLNLDDAKIIGTVTRTVTVVNADSVTGSSKALVQAGDKIAQELYGKLVDAWQNHQGIHVTISGLKNWNELHAIEDAVRKIPGISALKERGYEAGVADLDLSTALAASALAEHLNTKVGKVSLSVDAVSANVVKVSRH